MANNVFNFPQQSEPAPDYQSVPETFRQAYSTPQYRESPLADALTIADNFAYTPETQPEAFRLFIDDAKHIDDHRDTALEAVSNRNRGIFNAFGRWREPVTVEQIIESERGLTYSNASFWLGSKHDIGIDGREQQGEEVAHWYYHQYITNEDGSIGEMAIHYETRPKTMFKWISAIPYPVDVEEIGKFAQAVRKYKEKVAELHSPIDANLEMLQEEQEEEKIIDARTNMVMFSKPVVDKMVADFRARQQAGLLAAQEEAARQLQDQQNQASQAHFQARRDMNERPNWNDENRRAA